MCNMLKPQVILFFLLFGIIYEDANSQSSLEEFKAIENQSAQTWDPNSIIPRLDSIRPKLLEDQHINEYLYSSLYKIYCMAMTHNYMSAVKELDKTFSEIDFYSQNQDTIDYRCDLGLMIDLNILFSHINLSFGNSFLSENYARKALDISENTDDTFFRHSVKIQLLADSYNQNGDIHHAIQYYNIAIDFEDKNNPQQIYWLASISNLYMELKDNEKAEEYLYLAFKKYNEILELDNQNYLIFLEQNLIFMNLVKNKIKIENNQLDDVGESLDSTLVLKPIHQSLLFYYQLKGKVALERENFEKADTFFQKAIDYCLTTYNYNGSKIGTNYLSISRAYYHSNRFNESLRFAKLAINSLYTNKDPTSDFNYIKLLNHRSAYEALLLKTKSYIEISEIDSAKISSNILISVFDYMLNKRIISNSSKFHFVDKIKTDVEDILELLTNKQEYEFAFELVQKTHGILVSLEINEDKATEQFNIPHEYIEYLNKLKLKISQKESIQIRLDKDDKEYDTLNSDIIYIQGELNKAIETIENSNPGYHKIKYSRQNHLTTEQFQKRVLSDDSCLIEYLLGDGFLYTFIVTKNDIINLRSEIPSQFFAQIRALNNHIRALNSDVSFIEFLHSSNFLYDHLLKDALSHIPKGVDQLYIVSDNELNYIPFSVLFEKGVDNYSEGRYDKLPYFGRKYDISYHYSSALLSNRKGNLSANLCGFAPSFSSPYSVNENLNNLLHNQDEILLIKDITDGIIHVDSSATLPNLRIAFNDFNITHLATHATCNEEYSFESKIYMEDGPMYAYEIYNMPHNLDLAVLSACNTGDGELKKGEGIMSLARAFISSGCQSVVTSLWKVNDRNSGILMQFFYGHLWSGKSVSSSLAQSKRDYLNNVNSALQAHPYNWATFIAVGNGDLAIPHFPINKILVISIVLFFIIILFPTILRLKKLELAKFE